MTTLIPGVRLRPLALAQRRNVHVAGQGFGITTHRYVLFGITLAYRVALSRGEQVTVPGRYLHFLPRPL